MTKPLMDYIVEKTKELGWDFNLNTDENYAEFSKFYSSDQKYLFSVNYTSAGNLIDEVNQIAEKYSFSFHQENNGNILIDEMIDELASGLDDAYMEYYYN